MNSEESHLPEPAAERKVIPVRWLVRVSLLALLGLAILLVILGLRWSRMPTPFSVEEQARQRAAALDPAGAPPEDLLPAGYLTSSTLIALTELLLDKPGGFLSNDRFSPALFLDNMESWEYGALVQLRAAVNALRHDLSRAGSQSVEVTDLVRAEEHLNVDHTSWLFPSAESEYRKCAERLNGYLLGLAPPEATSTFILRPDNLDGYLRRLEKHLGSLTIRLRANANEYAYDPTVLTSQDDPPAEASRAKRTPRAQQDNVFYEARGSAFTMYHMLRALRTDYRTVLDSSLAMGAMNRALSELNAALQPMKSPVVMNGVDFGATPNHSLTLSAYLAKAHLAIIDLRSLLQAGGSSG